MSFLYIRNETKFDQSRATECVGLDWGFRDGNWKCCLKRNIKRFNKEGPGDFQNVVLLDGTCGTHGGLGELFYVEGYESLSILTTLCYCASPC